MGGDGLIARETSLVLRGNDEDFAPLRKENPNDGGTNTEIPLRLFAERLFRITAVGACDFHRKDRRHTPQAAVIGPEIGAPPNGCIRRTGGVAETHPASLVPRTNSR